MKLRISDADSVQQAVMKEMKRHIISFLMTIGARLPVVVEPQVRFRGWGVSYGGATKTRCERQECKDDRDVCRGACQAGRLWG
jgi:hypothetical protein